MKRLSPPWWTAMLVAVGLAAACGSALAYFTGGGTGSASAAVTKLSAPAITAANPGIGGTVSLAWTTVSAPGPEAVKYYVRRDGGSPGGNCAAPAVPAAATTCADGGVSIGTHSYTVTAVWRSWSATSSPSTAEVTIGQATHFTLAAASSTPAVAAADNLTITARDENENAVTSYTGSHSLTFSGAASSPSGSAPTVADNTGAAIAFGSATALTFSAGVAAVTTSKNGIMKLYASGAASIVASETSSSLTTPSPLAISVTPGTATKYTLAGTTTTPTAGGTSSLTITAQDTYGNTATAYAGSHNLVFSGASASPGGTLPTVSNSSGTDIAFGSATALTFSAGVAAVTTSKNGVMKLYASGAASILVSEGAIATPAALAVTVAAASASKLVLNAATTTPVAAAADNLTLTALDAYGNTASGYTGSKSITFSGAVASPSGAAATVVNSAGSAINFGSVTTLTFSAGVAAVATSKNGVMKLNNAGVASVTATDGTFTTAAVAFTVSVGSASNLALTSVVASAGSIGSPCLFTCAVTKLGNGGTVSANVSVTDSVGNTVSALGAGHSVGITASGGAIAEGALTIAATGPAVSSARFTYTGAAKGGFNDTITAAVSAGTAYANATATAGK